jgi:hypothetical protein
MTIKETILPLAIEKKWGMDITGMVFGRLTVTEVLKVPHKRTRCICQCSCGNTINVVRESVVSGNTKSCGCFKLESETSNSKTHGMSETAEFRAWWAMWRRTTDKSHKNYDLYKDRTPPEIWRDFQVFFAELGSRPSPKHSLDRINNDLPYGPGNCRWSTQKEQVNNTSTNKMLTYQGETKTAAQWAESLGIPKQTLYSRLYRGVPVDVALSTPAQQRF